MVAGLLAVVWVFTFGADPDITCRGVVLGPGDVCVNADGGREQTYEDRYAAAQDARPVVGVVGAAVAVFSCSLMVLERRRNRIPVSDGDVTRAGSSAHTQGDPRPTTSPQ